jgi:hypothetical protein
VAGSSSRRRLLAAKLSKRGDVLANEFVRCLWGGPVGFLISVEPNGMGLVHWLKQPGFREIIHTSLLKQA